MEYCIVQGVDKRSDMNNESRKTCFTEMTRKEVAKAIILTVDVANDNGQLG